MIFDRFWRSWVFLDVKIKLLDEFCFRFIYFSGLYDIWSHFSRPRMIVFEHKECPAWNTRDVLRGTQEMFCLEHTRCPAWNRRDVLLGTQEMSCLEHTRCPAWNTGYVLLGQQEMICLEHRKCLC